MEKCVIRFGEIFKELLIENNTDVQKVSKSVGIDDSVLYDYLHGIVPSIKFAVKLANYFNCSLNYMFGIDDIPTKRSFKQSYNLGVFLDRYNEILSKNNLTHYKLSKKTPLNYSSYNAWCRGSLPAMKSVFIIANYFDISMDYLIGRSDER